MTEFTPHRMNNEPLDPAPWVFLLVLILVSSAAWPAPAGAASGNDDVTVVETEVGLDQIVVRRDEDIPANRLAAVPAKPVDAAVGMARPDAGPQIDSARVMVINQTLKRVIEENQRLQDKAAELDQQLRNMRGQHNVEANRMKTLAKERDQYQAQIKQHQQEAEQLRAQLAAAQERLADKEREMRVMAATAPVPAAGTPDYAGSANKIEVPAEEIRDMRMTILSLQKQITDQQQNLTGLQDQLAAKEAAYLQLADDQKVAARAEIQSLQASLTAAQDELASRRKEIQSVLSQEREQTRRQMAGLAKEISALSELMNGKAEEYSAFQTAQQEATRQRQEELAASVTDLEQRLTEKEQALARSNQDPDSSSQVVELLRSEIKDLQQVFARKEEELIRFKQEQELAAQSKRAELLARVGQIEDQLAEREGQLAAVARREQEYFDENILLRNQLRTLTRGEGALAQGEGLAAADSIDQAVATSPSPSQLAAQLGQLRGRLQDMKHQLAAPVSAGIKSAPGPVSGPGALAVAPSVADPAGRDVLAMLDALSQENAGLRTDEARMHYNMGNIFFQKGEYIRAGQEYQQAVDLLPYDASAHFNLAFVASEYLKDFKLALKHYQQYLWLNPDAEDAALVKEKIIAAQIEVMGHLDSRLEKEWQQERSRVWR